MGPRPKGPGAKQTMHRRVGPRPRYGLWILLTIDLLRYIHTISFFEMVEVGVVRNQGLGRHCDKAPPLAMERKVPLMAMGNKAGISDTGTGAQGQNPQQHY